MKKKNCRRMNCFRVTTAIGLLLLSAVNVGRLHAENITWHRGAMGGAPETETVAKGNIKFVDKGFTVRNHVFVGWCEIKTPVLRSEAMEKIVMKLPTFHTIGSSADIQTDQTFYAVWAIDRNNDGTPDYNGTTLIAPPLNREFIEKKLSDLRNKREREERDVHNGEIFMRSDPQWDINFDLLAYYDSIYYVGCPYNTNQNDWMVDPYITFLTYKAHHCFGGNSNNVQAAKDLELVFEYGGVLEDSCLIGGKDQKPLKRLLFPADGSTQVTQLIDSIPFRFNNIKKDGVGILKMYFVRAGTDTIANDATDWHLDVANPPTHEWRNPSSSPDTAWRGHFPHPFWNAQTGAGDTLTIKFRIYNKPVFESETISQFLDTEGRLRINHLSGTPLKYMMRRINGWRWQPADSPLTDMEKEYIADNASICLRQLDKVVGYQAFMKLYFQSPEQFRYDDPDNLTTRNEFMNEIRYGKNKEVYDDIPVGSPLKIRVDSIINSLLPWGMSFSDALSAAFEEIVTFFPPDSTNLIDNYNYPVDMDAYTDSISKRDWNSVMGKRLADKIYVSDNRCRETFCLSFQKQNVPIIERPVFIPQVEGATIYPNPGMHYVPSQKDFKFRVKYLSEPMDVTTNRIVDGKEEVLTGQLNVSGEYEYVIRYVTESIELKFAPHDVSASSIEDAAIWSYGHEIRIRAMKEDVVSIYSITGQLVKRIVVPEGYRTIPMERGVYIVTLKDGAIHKIIIR